MGYLLREWWLVINVPFIPDGIFPTLEAAEIWQDNVGGEIVHVQEQPNFSGEDDGSDI